MKNAFRVLALLLVTVVWQTAFASEERVGVMSLNPSPSPNAQEVVFAADFDGTTSMTHLWISSLDGSRLRRLDTGRYALVDEEPAWSPDGSSIAFSSTNGGSSDIWSISPASTRLTQLTSNSLNNH